MRTYSDRFAYEILIKGEYTSLSLEKAPKMPMLSPSAAQTAQSYTPTRQECMKGPQVTQRPCFPTTGNRMVKYRVTPEKEVVIQ